MIVIIKKCPEIQDENGKIQNKLITVVLKIRLVIHQRKFFSKINPFIHMSNLMTVKCFPIPIFRV